MCVIIYLVRSLPAEQKLEIQVGLKIMLQVTFIGTIIDSECLSFCCPFIRPLLTETSVAFSTSARYQRVVNAHALDHTMGQIEGFLFKNNYL